jgi:hypothetical protein
MNYLTMINIQSIQNRVYEIRGEVRVLNQTVKRNIKRFPGDFMFRVTLVEWQRMRSQFVTAAEINSTMPCGLLTGLAAITNKFEQKGSEVEYG